MTNPNHDINDIFKEEIDATLFESIDFTSDLKHKVIQKIKPVQKETSMQALLNKIVKRRVASVISAAAILCIAIISVHMQNLKSPTTEENPINSGDVSILMEEGENTNPIEGKTSIKSWELKTLKEASQLFGNDLLLPAYVPNDFTLERIQASGINMDDPTKLVLTYQSAERSYIVIAEKTVLYYEPLNYEEVDINGMTGYLKKEGVDVELIWSHKGFQYMVGGLISSEEAIKIASSFK